MKKIIPFLVFCLVATCNADLRTWTAVNGKEVEAEFVSNEEGVVKLKLKSGKVFEVPTNKLSKEDNEFISSLSKPDGINVDELEEVEGIMWLKGPDTPYTGKAFKLHSNGQKSGEMNFKDGKLDGTGIAWHSNGQKAIEANYKDGEPDGLTLQWHSNGQKQGEMNFKDGKPDGPSNMWHENGQRAMEASYKDGKEDGLYTEWFENGQKAMEENYKDGKKISEKFWNSKGELVDTYEEAIEE